MARQYDHQTSEGDHPFAEDGMDVSQKDSGAADAPRDKPANPFSPLSQDSLYATTPEYEVSYSGRGRTVLVLGIVGVLCFGFTGYLSILHRFPPLMLLSLAFTLPAWQWGRHDLIAMRAGVMQVKGKGLTQAGKILGAAMTALIAAIVIVWTVSEFVASI